MMLIKSQDGISLTNFNSILELVIMTDGYDTEYFVNALYPHRESYVILGKYLTVEKAKNILQEIQNAYQYLMECKYIGIGSMQPEFVYQMPKEEDDE